MKQAKHLTSPCNKMSKLPLLIMLFSAHMGMEGNAAIVTGISQAAGPGGAVDFTSSTLLSWGYYAGGINQAATNVKSGTTAPVYSTSNTINTDPSTTNYGWTFGFNDGSSPTTGSNVSSSGSVNAIASGETFTLTFAGIVSSTETRILTLYLGSYAEPNGLDRIDETVTATLTGGSADELGTDRVYSALADSGNPGSNTTDANGIISAIYTVEFTSATETDLVLSFTASSRNGTAATGVSGYSLAVIPEPSSLALGAMGAALLLRRRRDCRA